MGIDTSGRGGGSGDRQEWGGGKGESGDRHGGVGRGEGERVRIETEEWGGGKGGEWG